MTQSLRPIAPVLEKMHQFLLWLIPTVDKFPRVQKFLLGDRIQTASLDVMERLIEAARVGWAGPHQAQVRQYKLASDSW